MRNEKARQRLMEYKKMDGTVQEMNLPTVAKWTDIVATRIAELESQVSYACAYMCVLY
jgi:hypothetical protein